MANDRLDAGPPSQLAADRRRETALLPRDEDAGPVSIMSAIAAIVSGGSPPFRRPLDGECSGYPRRDVDAFRGRRGFAGGRCASAARSGLQIARIV
jgi:hypothetical protein